MQILLKLGHLHNHLISCSTKSNVDVPIRTNNEPLFRFAKVN